MRERDRDPPRFVPGIHDFCLRRRHDRRLRTPRRAEIEARCDLRVPKSLWNESQNERRANAALPEYSQRHVRRHVRESFLQTRRRRSRPCQNGDREHLRFPFFPFSQAERSDYRHRRRRVHQQHQLPLRNRQRASLARRRHGGSDRPKRQRGGVSGAVHDADAAVDVDRVYLRSDAGAMADSPPARERRGRGVWNHRGRADSVHGQRGELGRRRGGESKRRRRCSTRKRSL